MIASRNTIEVLPGTNHDSEPQVHQPRLPLATDPSARDPADENLYLIGRPTLKRFLRFVRSNAADPPDEGTLADEWQAAAEKVRDLTKAEAGLPDDPGLEPLGVTPANEPLLTEFLQDPLVRNGFNTVPSEVALVELDRLVVFQHHIDLTYVRLLERELGPSPNEPQIFRTCLLHDHPRPPVKWSRTHGNTFVFVSPSNDLRFLGAMKLHRRHIADYPPPGDLAGVIGLAVGFGSNFLNAVHVENRLILNNGSHRAYALRKLGVARAPCLVQHLASRDQLEVIAGSEVAEKSEYYLDHPRPALLRDYFHPGLRKILPVHRRWHQIRVKFEVEEDAVPVMDEC